MDIYVLDELLRRDSIIDQYESLVWTERYSAWGDFELIVHSSREMRTLLREGTFLWQPKSYRVMVVETSEDTMNDEGEKALKVSGRSLELWLEDRVNRTSLSTSKPVEATIVYSGTPGTIARKIFDDFCRNNTGIAADNIPFLKPGSIFPKGTIPEPETVIEYRDEVGTVYDNVKKICDIYGLGFRLVRKELKNGAASELYFDIYTGDNRTSMQQTNSNVIFSPELDNLSNTTELTSIANLKNVAYVFGKNGSRYVYADGVDQASVTGFNRRVLMVKADDIDLPAGTALTAALDQRGKEELAKYRVVNAFDGEIPQFGSYEYGVHYDLGDLVEQRNADSLATNMRVTEQIFICDKEGERAYPTLSMDLLITPGSWYAWDSGQVWDDAPGYWDDAP